MKYGLHSVGVAVEHLGGFDQASSTQGEGQLAWNFCNHAGSSHIDWYSADRPPRLCLSLRQDGGDFRTRNDFVVGGVEPLNLTRLMSSQLSFSIKVDMGGQEWPHQLRTLRGNATAQTYRSRMKR